MLGLVLRLKIKIGVVPSISTVDQVQWNRGL